MIKFAYTILYVKDVANTIAFYEKAFDFKRKFITPDSSYGELIAGTTTLSFAQHKLAASNLSTGFTKSTIKNKPFGIELGFTTTDISKTIKSALKAGATLVEKQKTKPWSQKVAYVRDLDGFLIEICTPME
jgi:lactoylglutathione lyase